MASSSTNARCTGCSSPSLASPSTVVMFLPTASSTLSHARGNGPPIHQDVAGAARAVAATVARGSQSEIVAKHAEQSGSKRDVGLARSHRSLLNESAFVHHLKSADLTFRGYPRSSFTFSIQLYTIGQYAARSISFHMRLSMEPLPRTTCGKLTQFCGRAS